MAYHLGRLIHRHFHYDLVNVEVTRPQQHNVFTYDLKAQAVTLSDLDRDITDEDILVANPSFSNFLFGARLPGKKIMYAQGFNTHGAIDGHFDLYVSASSTVQAYMASVWGIRSSVIPPFIHTAAIKARPWHERPEGSVLVFMKQGSPENHLLYDFLKDRLGKRAPNINIETTIEGRNLSHVEFLKRISEVRYLVNLTIAEGFGLVPLEAMALGTMVTGLDGLAGKDYMRYGENCLVASFRELRALPDIVYRALSDETLARHCVAEGLKTAENYRYADFEAAWLEQLNHLLNGR